MQQSPTPTGVSVDDDGGIEPGHAAAGPPYEVLLGELLGPEKVHLVQQIHKLLLLESQAFRH